MIETLLFIIGLLLGAIILFFIGQHKTARLIKERNMLSNDVAAKDRELGLLNQHLEELKEQHELQMLNLREQYEEERNRTEKQYDENRQQLLEQFEQTRQQTDEQFNQRLKLVQEQLKTATEQLLKQRSEELDKTNQSQMSSLMAPLKDVMNEMKRSMDDNKESFTRSTSALSEQLRSMLSVTTNLGTEAERLAKALQTGPKIQGDFGEMKLNDLLDRFGFTKGLEYDVQYVMRDEKGKIIRNDDTNDAMRPDVVLHYPDHKDVIIDAKASFTAFINYVNAEHEEDKRNALDEHIRSVRKHVNELAAKQYNRYSMEGRETLDFVIMFVPNEAAMQLAVSNDPSLWSDAFEKKVFITGEQNLFAVLRMLQLTWTQQRQTENQERVFEQANLLVECNCFL